MPTFYSIPREDSGQPPLSLSPLTLSSSLLLPIGLCLSLSISPSLSLSLSLCLSPSLSPISLVTLTSRCHPKAKNVSTDSCLPLLDPGSLLGQAVRNDVSLLGIRTLNLTHTHAIKTG